MKEYMTVSGDTWDLICFKNYGNYSELDNLLAANPDHIETVIFTGGIMLKIPEVVKNDSESLPPWKRGV